MAQLEGAARTACAACDRHRHSKHGVLEHGHLVRAVGVSGWTGSRSCTFVRRQRARSRRRARQQERSCTSGAAR